MFGCYIPGFQFNPIAAQLCSRYDDGLNLEWNAAMMRLKTKAMLNQFPSASDAIFSQIPWQSNMNYLLDPKYTVMQFNQQYGSLGNGGFNIFGGKGGVNFFGGFDPSNFWKNVFGGNNNNNGSNGSSGVSGTTVEEKKLNALKLVFDKFKGTDVWNDDFAEAYNEALKKDGNQAKIDALNELLESVDSAEVKKAILSNSAVVELLKKSGYDVSSLGEKFYKPSENDVGWKTTVKSLANNIGKKDSNDLVQVAGRIKAHNEEIIQLVSAWNDSQTTGLLKTVAAKIPSAEAERTIYKEAVKAFTDALLEQTKNYTEYSSVESKKEEVEKALKEVDSSFTKANVEALSAKFDALYAEIRVLRAQEADKYIKENFGFINDVNEGAASDDAILEATKKDLKTEKISVPTTRLNNKGGSEQTAEERVRSLIGKESGKIVEYTQYNGKKLDLGGVKIYNSYIRGKDGYQYFTIRNGELVRIDCKSILPPNKVIMSDGTVKKFSELTESDFVPFSDDEILTTETKNSTGTTETTSSKKQTTTDFVNEDIEQIGIEGVGKRCAKYLIGDTDESEADYVEIALSKLTKDTILDFLKGYKANNGWGNGFFEQLAREEGDVSKRWTNKKVVSYMKMVMDAIPSEYKSSDEYVAMQEIYRTYVETANRIPNEKFITTSEELGIWNQICSWVGNSNIDDFDDALEDLLDKIGAGTYANSEESKES